MKRAASTAVTKVVRWGEERRLEFIDFRLLWEGRINRSDLIEFFGISMQQASFDISQYMSMAPGNLLYDRSEKVYLASKTFRPVLVRMDAQGYLNQLLSSQSSTEGHARSFAKWLPPCDAVQAPIRTVDADIVVTLLAAIRNKEDIEIAYQSMRRPSLARRWIAPHALAFDGARWHARAWCFDHSDFRDFGFARIQRIHRKRATEIDSGRDARWHTFVTLALRPSRSLTLAQRRAVEKEFGMQSGVLEVRLREALVFYFLRQMNLNLSPGMKALVKTHPVELVNEEAVKPLLFDATAADQRGS